MNEEKELLKLKRTYSIKYVLLEKLIEVYIFFGLLIALCFSYGKIFYGISSIIILLLIIFFTLIIEKKMSKGTFMKFYEDRIEFKGKMFFFKTDERVLKYNEIRDIAFTQGASFFERRFQKAFGFGNIYVYPKNGTFLGKGMQIELVSNINEKVEQIKNIVGDKII